MGDDAAGMEPIGKSSQRKRNKILRGRCNKLHRQVMGLIDKAIGNLDMSDIDIAQERENALRWERAAAGWEQRYYEMEAERNHWKSNHDGQVKLKRKWRPVVEAAIRRKKLAESRGGEDEYNRAGLELDEAIDQLIVHDGDRPLTEGV